MAPVLNLSQTQVYARPHLMFQTRPVCRVIGLRGAHRGASWDQCTDPTQSHEVCLEYPDGYKKWHDGPASVGRYGPASSRKRPVEFVSAEEAAQDGWAVISCFAALSAREPVEGRDFERMPDRTQDLPDWCSLLTPNQVEVIRKEMETGVPTSMLEASALNLGWLRG